MNRPPTHAPVALRRHSVGLTDAHKELIRLLAQRAVEIYLAEGEAEEPPDHEEATR